MMQDNDRSKRHEKHKKPDWDSSEIGEDGVVHPAGYAKASLNFKTYNGELPCTFLPSSWFFKSCKGDTSLLDVQDLYAVAAVCKICPLQSSCQKIGEWEGFGVWGGVARTNWSFYRYISNDDWPFR